MARVAAVPSTALPPEAAEIYEGFATGYGPFRNQAAVLAHVPSAAVHLMSLLMELKAQRNLEPRHLELAIVTVSRLNACEYCVAHHAPPLEIEGLSRETIDRLPEVDGSPELTEVDRLVIEYAVAVTNSAGRIRDRMFERLREHFSEAQIVELTLRIALCGFFNRFNDALMIDSELGDDAHASRA